MFTIKLYGSTGHCRILEAESFSILRGDFGEAEITVHQKDPEDTRRYDLRGDGDGSILEEGFNPVFQRAIIENSNGKTTEVLTAYCRPLASVPEAA